MVTFLPKVRHPEDGEEVRPEVREFLDREAIKAKYKPRKKEKNTKNK